jgi:ADP-heptose:LPS heptosyltransferase
MAKKIILKTFLSPGDIVMLTAVVRDLHKSHPGKYLTDIRTSAYHLWENNTYITPLKEDDKDVELIECEYPLIHQSNEGQYHFIHGYRKFLEQKLNIAIKSTEFKGDIHISTVEKSWYSQVRDMTGEDTRFWLVVSGGKLDYTCKWSDPNRLQQVVNHFKGKIQFVQIGDKNHHHPRLNNVIDLVGKTDIRQLVRLVYHADGVVCPVTFLMHLAAAVETKPGRPINRPCVVIAGGREPPQWEAYPHHQYLHTNGCLPCCDNGGCWKSRVIPIGDGDEKDHPEHLCIKPVRLESNLTIPKCIDMITAADIIRAVEKYLEWNNSRE